MALKEYYDAELIIGTFTYNKTNQKEIKQKTSKESDKTKEWWDERITPYIVDERKELARHLVWCGEMQILPTAIKPLGGMENYGGTASAIFPHVKHQMMSIPSLKKYYPQFMYTTGSCTEANYIQKKAGLKAQFHHVLGGLIVETDIFGDWWVRQINMDSCGVMYDLDKKVDNGKVLPNTRVLGVVYGDIHVAQLDVDVEWGCWDSDKSLAGWLNPEVQVVHDVFDGQSIMKYPRLHHEYHNMYYSFKHQITRVKDELKMTGNFLRHIQEFSDTTVVVNSNHDQMLKYWLQNIDYKKDPSNAEFFLDAERYVYDQIRKGYRNPNILEWSLRQLCNLNKVSFLQEDESFLVGDIECGMHGHLGPNGVKGTIYNLARMGYKSMFGHSHTAGIFEGAYQVGTSSKMDMGYNTGPSSWSHTHGIIYPNSKRTLVTMRKGIWRLW